MGPWLTNQVVCRHWGNVLQDLPALLRGQVLETLLLGRHHVRKQHWQQHLLRTASNMLGAAVTAAAGLLVAGSGVCVAACRMLLWCVV